MKPETFEVRVRFANGYEMNFDKVAHILKFFNSITETAKDSVIRHVLWRYFAGPTHYNSEAIVFILDANRIDSNDISKIVVINPDQSHGLSEVESIIINNINFPFLEIMNKADMLTHLPLNELGVIDLDSYGLVVNWLMSISKKDFHPFA